MEATTDKTAPTPLLPEPRSLMVLDSTTTLEQLFDTQSPIQPNRWQYIYIHHNKTRRPEAARALGEAVEVALTSADSAGTRASRVARRRA